MSQAMSHSRSSEVHFNVNIRKYQSEKLINVNIMKHCLGDQIKKEELRRLIGHTDRYGI
jgi:hypothetical protein